MTTNPDAVSPPLAALAGQEIRNYLRNRLFWVGAALWAVFCVVSLTGSDETYSTTGDGLGPAAVLGVLGIVVMAGLTRNSDRAALAAGAVAVPQRIRTLALAAAVVVPATLGLVWFGCAVIGYQLQPPLPPGAPFGELSEDVMYAQMFEQGVMSSIGGPLLGLVVGRWLPGRGIAPMVAVVVVLVTMVMQPLFDWAERPRLAWLWIHFHSPAGIEGDAERLVAHTGSPYFYIAYLAALCVLGVLVSMYRDPEGDRTRLRQLVLGTLAVAAVLCALAVVAGPDEVVPSPVPSSGAGT
jgi:hypothetical protein